MTRETSEGRCIGPGERMGAMDALKAVTIDAAYQIRKEDVLGSISPGKHADFVVLGQNPLTVPADALRDIAVHQTWLAGKQVWVNNAV